MFDYEKLLKFLMPHLSAADIAAKVRYFEETFILDYTSQAVLELNAESLTVQETKDRLIRTLMVVADEGENGPLFVILDVLEKLTKGTLVFENFSSEDQSFYLRFYAVGAMLVFDLSSEARQQLVCGTALLPLIISFEPEFYDYFLQRNFAQYCILSVLKQSRDALVKAMEYNVAILCGESISKWVADFRTGDFEKADSVEVYFSNTERFAKLDPYALDVLKEVIFIYRKLLTGEVWKEIDYHLCFHPPQTETHSFDIESFYLEKLQNAPDIKEWVDNYAEALEWLNSRSDTFIAKLFGILREKTNVAADSQLAMEIVEFINQMPEQRKEKFENWIIFNESDGKFYWNSQIQQ